LQIGRNQVWACALPVYHVGGMGIFTRALVSGGTCKIYNKKWNSRVFSKFLLDHAVAWTSLVPTQVVDLVKAGILAPASLRGVIVGGGALSPEMELAGIKLGWPLLKSYGMTEAGSQIATAKVAGGEMEILPHLKLRLDEEGRLSWTGKSKFSAYIVKSEIVFSSEWIQTKDKVNLNGQYLSFCHRSDRVVKILGELVDIDALETDINRQADQEVLLKLIEDDRRGVVIVPCIESPASEGLNELFSTYSGLRRLHPFEIKKFPRSALGKVMRAKL
jgi:o-succinylbenzoate---CoA ligase